jgi:transposase
MTKKMGSMSKRLRRDFSAEFKAEAVKLVKAGRKPVTQLARELEVPRQLLHSWVRQADRSAGKPASDIFPGNGKRPADEAELDRLRNELAQAKEDIEILKKATAFFAKHHR